MLAFKSRSTRCNSHNGLRGEEVENCIRIQVAARILISIPPPLFCWAAHVKRKEEEKLVQPHQQMMARLCIFLGLADWVNV